MSDTSRADEGTPAEFFISHSGADREWAEWIALQLSEEGYKTILDIRDWRPGQDFVEQMDAALDASCVIAVLSDSYFRRGSYSAVEWRAAFTQFVNGSLRLVPVVVEPCSIPPLLSSMIHIDLLGLDANEARRRLLEGVALRRPKRENQDTTGKSQRVLTKFPGRGPAVWGSIPARNAYFTGRDDLLLRLRAELATKPTALVPRALHGLAGVGKTQLAAEYAHRFASEYDLVWWIASEQPASLPGAVARLAPHLGLSFIKTVDEAIPRVIEALHRGDPYRRWLLIFDNAVDLASISHLLPPGGGHILITSRNSKWTTVARTIHVTVFSRSESISLLKLHLPSLPQNEAASLAEALGDLPVAVEQAAAWLSATGTPVSTFLHLLESKLTSLLDEVTSKEYPSSLAATWLFSMDRLMESDPAAVQLLEYCSVLAPEAIPLDLFTSTSSNLFRHPLCDVVGDPIQFARIVSLAGVFSLARATPGFVQLHRLTQAVIRDRIGDEVRSSSEIAMGRALAQLDPECPDNPSSWSLYSRILPHATREVDLGSRIQVAQLLLFNLIRYLYAIGDYASALVLSESIHGKLAASRHADDPDLLRSAHLIGLINWAIGNYQQAHSIHAETVEGFRRILGPDNLHTLRSAHGVAVSYQGLGEYEAALDIALDCLDRRVRTNGKDDIDALRFANTVAVQLFALHNYEDALLRDQETFNRRRRVLGEDHPDTLESANNFSNDLRIVGRLRESADLERDTLARRRRVFGDDHPHTLRSMHSLGITLLALGDNVSARTLLVDALERRSRILGASHAHTLATAHALAVLLTEEEDHSQAYVLADETLSQRYRTLGDRHPHTVMSMSTLANICASIGDLDRSLKLRLAVERWNRENPASLVTGNGDFAGQDW